jgi:hypothetical protein
MSTQLKSKSEPTAREAAANVDAKKEAIANPNLAIAKNLVVKESASAELIGRYKLTSDPKLASVLNAMPKQSQIMNREMAQGLNDKGIVDIDAERAAEIEEACINKSTTNNVVGTYLPLSLGNDWPKGRGSQKLRDAMGGNSFTVWTRV